MRMHTPGAAQKHTHAPNTHALAFKEVFIGFAPAFPCTACSAPTAGRAAHHLTAYDAQHGYAEVRGSPNEPEYSMNEEGDGPSNRTKSLAIRHPTSYEFAIALEGFNDPEYSINEEGDGPMPPGTARSDSSEESQDEKWQQLPQLSSQSAPRTGPPAQAAMAATPAAGMAAAATERQRRQRQ
jgi:hypothetical protein